MASRICPTCQGEGYVPCEEKEEERPNHCERILEDGPRKEEFHDALAQKLHLLKDDWVRAQHQRDRLLVLMPQHRDSYDHQLTQVKQELLRKIKALTGY
jgi:hypothetical protein